MVCSGGGFPQLQKLAFLGLENWEDWILEERSMPLLHSLKIANCEKLKQIPDGLEFTSLKELVIFYCRKLKQLPEEQHFPSHLTTITIERCGLEVNPMLILEKLLHLKHVTIHGIAFCGRKMVSSAGGFPQLQELNLSKIKIWKEWEIKEGSMPLLRTLYIGKYCFPELPDGLRFITSLKNLVCELSGTGWRERVSKGGEDYYKVQHIPYVKMYGDEDGYDSDYSE